MSKSKTVPGDHHSDDHHPKPDSRWLLYAIVPLVALFSLVIIERNTIRAYWFAHRLARTDDLSEQGYYLASLAAMESSASGAIERLSRNETAGVRFLAVIALRSLPEEAAIGELARLLRDSDLDVRESAALALAFMDSSEALDTLCHTARSDNPNAAAAAVTGLARSQSTDAPRTLSEILTRHPSPRVRAQAAESLYEWLLAARGWRTSQAPPPERGDRDFFVALVQALSDDAIFSGDLALERSIMGATRFAIAGGNLTAEGEATSQPTPTDRTVANIAANGLSLLTDHPIQPVAVQPGQRQAGIADQCHKWYRDTITTTTLPSEKTRPPHSETTDRTSTGN